MTVDKVVVLHVSKSSSNSVSNDHFTYKPSFHQQLGLPKKKRKEKRSACSYIHFRLVRAYGSFHFKFVGAYNSFLCILCRIMHNPPFINLFYYLFIYFCEGQQRADPFDIMHRSCSVHGVCIYEAAHYQQSTLFLFY